MFSAAPLPCKFCRKFPTSSMTISVLILLFYGCNNMASCAFWSGTLRNPACPRLVPPYQLAVQGLPFFTEQGSRVPMRLLSQGATVPESSIVVKEKCLPRTLRQSFYRKILFFEAPFVKSSTSGSRGPLRSVRSSRTGNPPFEMVSWRPASVPTTGSDWIMLWAPRSKANGLQIYERCS